MNDIQVTDLILARLDRIEEAVTINREHPMTREQAAKYLRIPEPTLDELRKSGELDYAPLSGGDEKDRHIRYTKSMLDAYLRKRTRKAV